ncbi:SCP2 sterol-binding domain-containing protein [Ornithinibacillus californiensis]|uniref:SCP2 sterol-binding domain-containing protein n=1 Tax=Ornithinibacillus californiensis TaxID=161536 RepID=UPI00064DCC20|nr:SCP2 sterol-binding domain-containing protein [Ornithinibacillus californiensis]
MDLLANGTMEEIWKEIEVKLSENPNPYATMKATYEIQITDEEASYQLRFENGTFSILASETEKPDCTLKMKNATFRKFLAGNLNSMTAFMTGKLKVDGNIGLALKLESVLKEYQF